MSEVALTTSLEREPSNTWSAPAGPDRGDEVLRVEALRKRFGDLRRRRGTTEIVQAIDEISLTVHAGEVFTLLGPSGCGKSTTLRAIAGIERPDEGRIQLAGQILFDSSKHINVPPNLRGLGMVFQSYAIWPHMSVSENVSFPLRAAPRSRRISDKEIRERTEAVLEVVGLAEWPSKPATQLSGGQQQRVALARALAGHPALLLLDEPLSNLDAKLRESMRMELRRLQRELGLTMLLVTHDQREALAMSDRIAVISDGRVVQEGRPRELYLTPHSRYVAEATGAVTLIPGRVQAIDGDLCLVETLCGEIWGRRGADLGVGADVQLGIRPEAVRLGVLTDTSTSKNSLEGRLLADQFMGADEEFLVEVKGVLLRGRSDRVPAEVRNAEVLAVEIDPRSCATFAS